MEKYKGESTSPLFVDSDRDQIKKDKSWNDCEKKELATLCAKDVGPSIFQLKISSRQSVPPGCRKQQISTLGLQRLIPSGLWA